MAQIDITQRHHAIISFLRNRGKASFEEIREYLASQSVDYDLTVSKRTFLRDVADIASTYNIEILCNRRAGNVYYINNEIEAGEVAEYALESFELFMAFNAQTDLNKYVQLETRKPKGVKQIYPLLQAIRSKVEVQFDYNKFSGSDWEARQVRPLGLKESIGRWYLLAHCTERDDFRTFALDRMENLSVTTQIFKTKEKPSVFERYRDCFGIVYEPTAPLEEIVLSFTPMKGRYIKSYPLHHSQQILLENEDEIRVSLYVYQTYDFLLELLKHTGDFRIISPQNFKNRYVEFLERGLKMNIS